MAREPAPASSRGSSAARHQRPADGHRHRAGRGREPRRRGPGHADVPGGGAPAARRHGQPGDAHRGEPERRRARREASLRTASGCAFGRRATYYVEMQSPAWTVRFTGCNSVSELGSSDNADLRPRGLTDATPSGQIRANAPWRPVPVSAGAACQVFHQIGRCGPPSPRRIWRPRMGVRQIVGQWLLTGSDLGRRVERRGRCGGRIGARCRSERAVAEAAVVGGRRARAVLARRSAVEGVEPRRVSYSWRFCETSQGKETRHGDRDCRGVGRGTQARRG